MLRIGIESKYKWKSMRKLNTRMFSNEMIKPRLSEKIHLLFIALLIINHIVYILCKRLND